MKQGANCFQLLCIAKFEYKKYNEQQQQQHLFHHHHPHSLWLAANNELYCTLARNIECALPLLSTIESRDEDTELVEKESIIHPIPPPQTHSLTHSLTTSSFRASPIQLLRAHKLHCSSFTSYTSLFPSYTWPVSSAAAVMHQKRRGTNISKSCQVVRISSFNQQQQEKEEAVGDGPCLVRLDTEHSVVCVA